MSNQQLFECTIDLLTKENSEISSVLSKELKEQQFSKKFISLSKKAFSNSEMIKVLSEHKDSKISLIDFSNGSFFVFKITKRNTSEVFYAVSTSYKDLSFSSELDVDFIRIQDGKVIASSNILDKVHLFEKFEEVYVDILPSVLKASFTTVGWLSVWGVDDDGYWKSRSLVYSSDIYSVLSQFNNYDDYDFLDLVN